MPTTRSCSRGVLQEGPDLDSVWRIGLISGRVFFTKKEFVLGGQSMSLKRLEDDIVRARYEDPRIHAALNCASISCPRLPQVPFRGEGLDEQLEAAMLEFVGQESNCTVDSVKERVSLSKIFDWFDSDFVDYEERKGNLEGTVVDYVNRYRAKGEQIPEDYRLVFFAYDKGLNSQ